LQANPQPLIPKAVDDLDTLVRRVDEDRWLASRFAPADVRARLIAIYAVNYEIARVAETVTERGLGEIKLQWWREAIGEVFDGGEPRSHPALIALRQAVQEAPLSRARFDAMIQARRTDFETQPFSTRIELADYIDKTARALMLLGVEACGVTLKDGPIVGFATTGAWRWAVTGILRAEPVWRARGRNLIPPDYPREEILTNLRDGARWMGRWSLDVPPKVFPAFGYATLTRAYVRRDGVRASALLLERQLRLIWASATGRL
jgi:15-cis-phytoene synthase